MYQLRPLDRILIIYFDTILGNHHIAFLIGLQKEHQMLAVLKNLSKNYKNNLSEQRKATLFAQEKHYLFN